MNELQNTGPRTISQLWQIYFETHAKPHCKSHRNMERIYKTYLGRWHDRDIHSIKRIEVAEWHSALAEEISPTTANRAKEQLCMLYNWAIRFELIEKNPAANIRKFRLKSRERFLQEDELPRFFAALGTLRYETTRDFVLISLFAGARRSNVAAMRWDQILWDRQVWHLPDTKNGTSQYIPLVLPAMSILKERKRNASPDCPWVFPSARSPSGHLTKPEKAWREVVKRAGLDNVRLHDLRRTLASYEAITGANISVIGATLNHKDIQSTAIYARLCVEPVRQAMSVATATMLKSSGITFEKEEEQAAIMAAVIPQATEEWIDEKKAAKLVGTTGKQLALWRMNNEGPPYLTSGSSIRYHAQSLMAWMHNRQSTRPEQRRRRRLPNDLITEAEAAELIGIKEERLAQLRKFKKGPAYERVAQNRIGYRTETVIAWAGFAQRTIQRQVGHQQA